jgi:hypothetical protein
LPPPTACSVARERLADREPAGQGLPLFEIAAHPVRLEFVDPHALLGGAEIILAVSQHRDDRDA